MIDQLADAAPALLAFLTALTGLINTWITRGGRTGEENSEDEPRGR